MGPSSTGRVCMPSSLACLNSSSGLFDPSWNVMSFSNSGTM